MNRPVISPRLTTYPAKAWLFSAADWIAAGVLLTLPWSTSATAILIVLWLLVVFPTFDAQLLRSRLGISAVYLPMLLWAFVCVGMLWADVAWHDRLDGLRPFHKLLLIPPLMIHFSRSANPLRAIFAFLVSALVLLAYSWVSFWWPGLVWGNRIPGVPVKDYIYQSICFVLAACGLLHFAITSGEQKQHMRASLCLLLVVAFLANLAYVATSRTALVVLAVLLVIIGYQRFGPRGMVLLVCGAAVLGSLAWATSPYLRTRVTTLVEGALHRDRMETSESLRVEYWRRSLAAMSEAPLIGHGTGYIRSALENIRVAQQGGPAVANNPHNQTFAVGIQLGLAGVLLLYAMWLSHLLLFRGGGWAARLGLLVVVQNVVASVFNSHLSDFTAGWLYVFGVGILGGAAIRERAARAASLAPTTGSRPSTGSGRV